MAATILACGLLAGCAATGPDVEPSPAASREGAQAAASPSPTPTPSSDPRHPDTPHEQGMMPSTDGGLVSFPSQQHLPLGTTAVSVYVEPAAGVEKPVGYVTLTDVTARPAPEPHADGSPMYSLTFVVTVEAVEEYLMWRSDLKVVLPDGRSFGFFETQQRAPDEMEGVVSVPAGETLTLTRTVDAPATAGELQHTEPLGLSIASWDFSVTP
ncbi:hypothetical protein OMK64_02420 [Cellulomonas fimi]|uniref:hypothetical protein n=1 Tax=Cellulomonas fimi TaxID=1708 RepID=UPI00234DC48D|nr:hypothetical protein [Cellulomonas fimi]MDC7120385.1 hypothetical protein [Cellulomonas fimi]